MAVRQEQLAQVRCQPESCLRESTISLSACSCSLTDLINMLTLGYTPRACAWVHKGGRAGSVLAM